MMNTKEKLGTNSYQTTCDLHAKCKGKAKLVSHGYKHSTDLQQMVIALLECQVLDYKSLPTRQNLIIPEKCKCLQEKKWGKYSISLETFSLERGSHENKQTNNHRPSFMTC